MYMGYIVVASEWRCGCKAVKFSFVTVGDFTMVGYGFMMIFPLRVMTSILAEDVYFVILV